jgi:outer membrane receptor protein involved in Fe transport
MASPNRLQSHPRPVLALLALAGCWPVAPAVAEPLEEIVVTASLRAEPLAGIAASVTVLDEATVQAAGVRHFADLLGLVPNLNWAGGSSRPRYLQLRGIGELEQYQGAPNPSVAFLVDEFDLSGIGMPASTVDLEQVEVLRGPQGTRHGANALAGMVKLKTHDADGEPELRTRVEAGGDDFQAASLVAGGPLADGSAGWRLAAQQQRQDGFRDNGFLDREDTNGRDEATLRGKLRVELGDDWQLAVAGLYVDLDNGYDAFAPDNSLRTRSDRPGRDAQRTVGASVLLRGEFATGELSSATAWVDSDIVYSFDGDWGNDAYWGEYAPYDYFTRYGRERSLLNEDLRWLAGGPDDRLRWLAGLYVSRLEETNLQRDDFAGAPFRPLLHSEYRATHLAPYAQLDWSATARVELSAGMRVERRSADYEDSDGAEFAPTDTMVGGHLSASIALDDGLEAFAALARGYKAGGFNIGQFVPDERREFAPEYLWNLEGGMRYADGDGTLRAEATVFYMRREDQQVATSFQLDPGDPLSYVFFVDNAASGRNYGLEAALQWQATDTLAVGGSLGWLETEYLDYRYGERNLDGRAQAHAPQWQYALHADWRARSGLGLRIDLQGVDAFYFDASHDLRSEPYTLVHLSAGWVAERWSLSLWARNALDEDYAVRGFYFGLEPPDYANALYVQRGDPRQLGLSFEWRWP